MHASPALQHLSIVSYDGTGVPHQSPTVRMHAGLREVPGLVVMVEGLVVTTVVIVATVVVMIGL
jgi:hypothetical protein